MDGKGERETRREGDRGREIGGGREHLLVI
jgi:hypothetical protein